MGTVAESFGPLDPSNCGVVERRGLGPGTVYPGVDFSEGIAAAFTATASLLMRMRTGNPDCAWEPAGGDCALARPVVETVFAWTNTGTTRALPRPLLLELLQQRPGLAHHVDANHVAAALEWATGRTVE